MIDIHVDQIMSDDLVTVGESERLARAGSLMRERNVNSMVVTDAAGQPVGIVTSTDFVRMAADEQSPTAVDASTYMTRDIVTTGPETVVHEAANMMLENDISHLPVVGDDDSLVGIVTTTDVAKYVSGIEDLLPEG